MTEYQGFENAFGEKAQIFNNINISKSRNYWKYYEMAFENRIADVYHKIGNDEIAIIHDDKKIIFLFEGSKGFLDWFSNFRFKLKKKDWIDIHKGFLKSAKKFLKIISTVLNSHKDCRPVYVGYSRGADIALICAVLLSVSENKSLVFTYGQAKAFEYQDAKKLSKLNTFEYYRVYFKKDPVPGVPFKIQGYGHIEGTEVVLKEKWYHKIPLLYFRIKCHKYYKEVLA